MLNDIDNWAEQSWLFTEQTTKPLNYKLYAKSKYHSFCGNHKSYIIPVSKLIELFPVTYEICMKPNY